MAIAVMAFGVLRTVVDMYYAGIDATAVNRLITRQAVSYIFTLPYSYRDQMQKSPVWKRYRSQIGSADVYR